MNMNKETQCTEVGCTRLWTIVLTQRALTTMDASVGQTAMQRKVCEPCAAAVIRMQEA